jgi:hypothetical protein
MLIFMNETQFNDQSLKDDQSKSCNELNTLYYCIEGHTEADYDIVAKTCGCQDIKRKVTYSFIDSYHSL